VSRLRKTAQPFRWTAIPVAFTQGTAASVNLAAYLSNPQGRTITYSTVGSLPTGVTLSGSTVSYNGTAVAATVSVRFRATSGSYEADSDITTVSIAPVVGNSDPVWLTPTNLGTITANTPFSFTLTAVDPDSDPISFIVGALPGATTATPQLQSGTSRVVVVAGTGLSAGTYTFTINADDEPPLGQVFGLVASALSTTSIALAWTAVSDATGYTVERSPTGSSAWTVLGTVATTSYTSTGLAPGTLYFYRVRALSATQTGEYSAATSATTSAVAVGQEQDWLARSTASGVVFAHDFRDETEVTAFLSLGGNSTRDAGRTLWSSTGISGTGGGALNSRCYGTTLAAPVSITASGATDTWTVVDATLLPDVATYGACILLVGSTTSNGEQVRLTARNLASNTITVTRGGGTGLQGSPKEYPVGQKVGTDPSDNWHRPLHAVAAPHNGKTTDDIGITQGHSVARPYGPWTADTNERHRYGYWGAEQANYQGISYTDEAPRSTFYPDAGALWEGTEFYLQFRAKWSAQRFGDNVNGKWFYIDAHAVGSGLQQIFGNFQGDGEVLPAVPVWRRSYGDSRAIAGPNFTTTAVETPGGQYTTCLVNDPRNPDNCFTIRPNQWVTFLVHLKPGFSNYLPPVVTTITSDLTMLTSTDQSEADIVVADASAFPDPATWGTYPLEVRGTATAASGGGTRTEIMKVLSKTGNTFHVMRNWWRSSGVNYVLPAGTTAKYGEFNRAPDTSEASWLNDPHMCPYHDSYLNVYAAYDGETAYRTVMQSPALPFVYGHATEQGFYGNGYPQMPGYQWFKPESYMNAYIGSGSQGPPVYFDAFYTQIILSRNPIACPSV
jgi:hypothetical protein